MKIRQKLTLLLLFIGLVPTVVVSIIAYITISTQLTIRIEDQLESIAIKQEQRLNAILQGKQEEVLKLANRYDLQLALSNYLSGKNKDREVINSILRVKKTELQGLQAIYLSGMDGKVLASTAKDEIPGTHLVKEDFIKAGETNSIVLHKDQNDELNKLYIATSININKKDTVILTLIFSIEEILSTIQDYTGLGNSGETLIAATDAKGDVVSLFPERFDPDGTTKTNLNSLQLLQHHDATYTNVKDYLNNPVIVSTRHSSFSNWIIAVVMNSEEALSPIAQLRNTLIFIVIAVAIMIILISVYLTNYLTRPIVLLTQKTREIMQGDFSQRVPVTSSDEIGTLAATFNEMTARLQDLYQGLEQKVREKTAELAQKMTETERINKMMLGRELKMIELKEEIKKLQEQLNQKQS